VVLQQEAGGGRRGAGGDQAKGGSEQEGDASEGQDQAFVGVVGSQWLLSTSPAAAGAVLAATRPRAVARSRAVRRSVFMLELLHLLCCRMQRRV
jgi:hypothetical protein